MNKFDFIPDRAIKSTTEDELNRSSFANQLKNSLSNWEDSESLVISLRGEWGEGKSSVINLLKEQFKIEKKNNDPTIIEFNPWAYSNKDSLTYHFFNDISGELKLKKEESNDATLAKKIKLYSQLINIDNETKLIKDFIPNLTIFLGVIGISISKIFDWINTNPKWIGNTIFILSLSVLCVQLFSGLLNKFALYLESKTISKDTTTQGIKNDIIDHLKKRSKKLLIIIDDIDRLSQKEICEVFKLIRVNADFPNTIYLLAFDYKIIEANLKEQKGISGKEYLKKIVQVDFNLPYTKIDKIQQFLFKELDKIIAKLPSSIIRYFGQENNYWINTYHSGYKNFFKNIRDVKRYINSLIFNLNFLHRQDIFEVNPIDFIALESIRVFTPEYYDFIKIRKDLFTDPVNSNKSTDNQRKTELQEGFKLVDPLFVEDVKKLINHLFPNLDPLLKEIGGSHYAPEFYISWRKELRICSKENFDAFFTLNPDENESEVTQYDLQKFLSNLNDPTETEKILNQAYNDKKLRPLLRRIQDYSDDRESIPEDYASNLLLALNNIFDFIPDEKEGFFESGIDMEIARIYYQLLSRENTKTSFKILSNIIDKTKGIFAVLHTISIESSGAEKNEPSIAKRLFEKDDLLELQKKIINKVERSDMNSLLSNEHFIYIINRWKDWGNANELDKFIHFVKNDKSKFLKFLNHFVSISRSISVGNYGTRTYKQVGFKNLSRFIDISEVKSFISLLDLNSTEVKGYSDYISMFNRDCEKYIKNPDGYSNFDYD